MLDDHSATSPSATLYCLPARRAAVVWLIRQEYEPGWLVLAGGHGWVHGSSAAALTDAQWLSRNLALPVREITTRGSS
jgi:hypothetical protein